MNTCLFFILLISVTSIILIDAGCGPRPDISNAVFTDDENCNDIKITCKNGYRMHQLFSCVDGQWIYQEPNCALVEVKCQYNFTMGLVISTIRSPSTRLTNNIDECKEDCDNDEECGTFFAVPIQGNNKVECAKYPRLVLRRFEGTNLTQCIEECNKEEDCITFTHNPRSCLLFNFTLSNIQTEIYFIYEDDAGTTGEKLC